jgi:hypothetical protein
MKIKRTKTCRGFHVIEFSDRYGVLCELQQSSLADFDQPGTSAVWLGPRDANPQIMAHDAARLGVKTTETTGWIPFPISDDVLLTTRMHLDLEQVKWLIQELQHWVDQGELKGCAKAERQNEDDDN